MTRTPLRVRQQPAPRFFPAPALLGVGALLLCTGPAGAQTITLGFGGSATVSGAGTTATGNFLMFGGGAGPGTSSYLTGDATNGILNLQNGGSFQSVSGGTINVFGGTAGTVADEQGTNSRMDSINISGGTVTTVTNDRGSVSISGGAVQSVGADTTDPNQTGPITLSGGNIQNVKTPGGLSVSGGTLGSVVSGTFAGSPFGVGNAAFTGGTIQSLTLEDASAGISGGNIASLTNYSSLQISGGGFQIIDNFGIINILGTSLREIGTPIDANDDGVFRITGLLSDGETLNAQYTQEPDSINYSKLQFNGVTAAPSPVPEASTVVSLGGMLLLGGAGLAFRARKRAQA